MKRWPKLLDELWYDFAPWAAVAVIMLMVLFR